MKYSNYIHSDIIKRFEAKTNKTIQPGSVIDLYSNSISNTLESVYQEIEDNKNPHIWTRLKGKELDATGIWVGVPRKENESDESYKYRLFGWKLSTESSNETAINNNLILPEYAENIKFIPFTHGCGTATCYVLPKEYTEKNMLDSVAEAKRLVSEAASPGLYVEYIIPEIKAVSLDIYISSITGDQESIKAQIEKEIKEYINSIPPFSYLEVGAINSIGINTPSVNYFNVLSVNIDGKQVNKVRISQPLKSKMIFDEINWLVGDQDD